MANKSRVLAATLLTLAWGLCVLSVLIAYGVAEMYPSSDSLVRSGIATGLEVGGLPLMLVVLVCLVAVVTAVGKHRLLLWLAVATAPVGFLAVAAAGAAGAMQADAVYAGIGMMVR